MEVMQPLVGQWPMLLLAFPTQKGRGCAVWVCVLGFGLLLRPAIPGWGVGVCVFVCALRLYPAKTGWGLWCVCLGSGFGFHPANPGWGAICIEISLDDKRFSPVSSVFCTQVIGSTTYSWLKIMQNQL